MSYSADEEEKSRFEKAYAERVREEGSTYSIKYFMMRVISMGANTCMLEDLIEGKVELFLEERKEWWGGMFKEIRRWTPEDVDHNRLTWVKCS